MVISIRKSDVEAKSPLIQGAVHHVYFKQNTLPTGLDPGLRNIYPIIRQALNLLNYKPLEVEVFFGRFGGMCPFLTKCCSGQL